MANIFDGVEGTALNILGAARQYYKGIGLSQRAHELTSSYLDESKSALNSILSMGITANSTTEYLQQKIKALRAATPQSQIAESLRDGAVDENADNGNVAAGTNGTTLDEEA